ncbi:MAG: hypothetical protein EOO01_19495, partial [Chitinophagaceae bacterium]
MKSFIFISLAFFGSILLQHPALAQDRYDQLETLLKRSNGENIEQVFHKIKAITNNLPDREAIAYENELLHTAALLPHSSKAFDLMYELTKLTYTEAGQEDNLFLYLLSIANDPAFEKPEIQKKIQYEIGFSYYNIDDYGKAQVTLEKFVNAYAGPVNRDLING